MAWTLWYAFCMPPCKPVQSLLVCSVLAQGDITPQTRLPTIAHELRSDEALQFAERCQLDDAFFRQAVAGVAELIDWPEVETLSLLRLAPCFPDIAILRSGALEAIELNHPSSVLLSSSCTCSWLAALCNLSCV